MRQWRRRQRRGLVVVRLELDLNLAIDALAAAGFLAGPGACAARLTPTPEFERAMAALWGMPAIGGAAPDNQLPTDAIEQRGRHLGTEFAESDARWDRDNAGRARRQPQRR
jgi:hypothetical protein